MNKYIRIYEDFYGKWTSDFRKFRTYEEAASTLSTDFAGILSLDYEIVTVVEFAGYKQQQSLEDLHGIENA